MFSIYLHCTIAPICCHCKQFIRQDPCNELAITSQQFHFSISFFPLPLLSCQNESTSTLHCQRQLPQPVKTKKIREKSDQLYLIWVILFQCEYFMYEVCGRFLYCMSSMQTCKYCNSDESACWVTAQYNSLKRYVTCISNFFSSDSGITFAMQFIGYTHKSNWQNKRYDHIIWGQYHWGKAGSNIPSDTMQIMSCSDYKNRAGYIHTCLDTAQLPATDTLPVCWYGPDRKSHKLSLLGKNPGVLF